MSAELLWQPSPERVERATLTRFARERGLPDDYGALWRWSVDNLDEFWAAIWNFFSIDGSYENVLGNREMPGAEWFPGSRLSYAHHIFRGKDDGAVAIRHASELRELGEWTWGDLRNQTARIATGLRRLGVGEGDRVVAYMPNIPETAAAFLACASIGATWSSCSPDFGARSVVDRFAQIEPKVLLAVRRYQYNGRQFDRSEALKAIVGEMPGVRTVVLGEDSWASLTSVEDPLEFDRVPFAHPLWVLYSSG